MSNGAASLLIVDDDPVFAEFVRQLVLSLGADFPCVPECADAAESAMAELSRGAYDLVLLDYHLPGADGLQMLAQIRDLSPDRQPAVVMLTGSGNESIAVEAMKCGARDYLPKLGLDSAPLLRALRNALTQKQLADQVARYHAQTRSDLEMARHLQQSLLPDGYPSFPPPASLADSSLRFAHRFCPAAELAGDFFTVFPVSDFRAGVFLCDVMGHGVRSALVTAMVRAFVDTAVPCAADPDRFLSELNRRLHALLKPADSPLFATAFYLVADSATGRLCYAAAGHPAPLHLRCRAGQVASLSVPPHPGPALGMFADVAYVTGEGFLDVGDQILLFTDGLFEVMSPDGREEFGRQRLLDAVRQHLNLAPSELCDALINTVRAFAGGAAFSDDVCLLSVEVARLQTENAEGRDKTKAAAP